MKTKIPIYVKLCWSWIALISIVTILHGMYRSHIVVEGLQGNILPNLLNPNQPNDPDYVANSNLAFLHIIPGIIIYLFGPLQFSQTIRSKIKILHKLSGYLFALATITSGIAAISMAIIFPAGGASETTSSILFSSLMIFCLGRALFLIKQKKIELHRQWMIRTYMIALGPGTMHFIIPFFIQLGGKTIGEALAISLWLGFATHWLLAQVWIHYTSPEYKKAVAKAVAKTVVPKPKKSLVIPQTQQVYRVSL